MNRKIILLPLSFAAILALAACNPSTNSTTSVTPVESSSTPAATVTSVTVTAADSATSVYVGKTVQLSAVVAGTGDFSQNVSWKSSDETKATISTTGLVTGVASAAEVTFTATSKTDTTKSGTIKLAIVVKYDKIEEITAAGTYNMAGVVATVTSKGYVLDDGAAAIYVYAALPTGFKKGDYVAVSGTVSPYFATWEVATVDSVVAIEGTAPTLAAATALTDTIVEDWKTKPGSKTETAAALATTEIKPYTWTGVAQPDGSYTYWNIGTSTVKVEPSNVASGSFSWIAGVEYTVVAYPNGYNSSASYAGMLIVSSTPNYKPLTGITLDASTKALNVGQSATLSVVTAPTGANPDVTWSSSDSTVVKVDGGSIEALKAGTATITATSTVNTSLTATCVVTVTAALEYTSVAKYDYSALTYANTSTYGKIADAAGALTLFDGTDTSVTITGTSPVTAVTTVTNAYYGNPAQGPLKNGLKLGGSSAAGVLTLTSSVSIAEVKITAYAWGATKLADISVGGATAQSLDAASATTAATLTFEFTGTTSISINTTKYCVITGIELLKIK